MAHRSDSYASLHGADADDESQPITQTRHVGYSRAPQDICNDTLSERLFFAD